MSETTILSVRLPKDLKEESSQFFKSCGMTTNQAIQLFLNQCMAYGRIPFEIIPREQFNAETIQALDDAVNGRNCSKKYTDVKELLKDLHADD